MPQLTIQQAFDLAVQHHRAGRLQDAEGILRQILAQQPQHVEAIHALGIIALQVGRHDIGVDLIRRAIALKPDFADAHCNLGKALDELGRPEEAVAAYHQAIAIKPNLPEAYNNLGNTLKAKGQLDEAVAAYDRAIALHPDYPEAHSNLANALREKGQIDRAIEECQMAIALRPDYPEAYNNLGAALYETRRVEETIAAFRHAVALDASLADAHFNLASALLLRGDFRQGWEEHEWRAKRRDFRAIHAGSLQPQWDGSNLANRTILLRAEQGLGDTIQFIRYVPLVAERGGKVIFVGDPQLRRLLQGTSGIAAWVSPGAEAPRLDAHCSLLSLPLVFQTTLESIPAKTPYVFADPTLRESWKGRLVADASILKVGLVWAGNPRKPDDRKRSIKLAELAALLRTGGVRFFSLQKGEAAAQAKALPEKTELVDWTNELNDFADTAALIDNLDLVISVDTAVAHLAGAMGKPVWVMLPFAPDWRWLLERNDSPWYPTMRLIRQSTPGDWASVMVDLTNALSLWAENQSSRTG